MDDGPSTSYDDIFPILSHHHISHKSYTKIHKNHHHQRLQQHHPANLPSSHHHQAATPGMGTRLPPLIFSTSWPSGVFTSKSSPLMAKPFSSRTKARSSWKRWCWWGLRLGRCGQKWGCTKSLVFFRGCLICIYIYV